MPANKKSKKPYKPKFQPGAIPVCFRFTPKAELKLQIEPQTELASLRTGSGNQRSIDTLDFRLRWGLGLSRRCFKTPEVTQSLEQALSALEGVKNRAQRTGAFGATGEEFFQIGNGLNYTDEMQLKSTRANQLEVCLNVQSEMLAEDKKAKL